MAMRGLTVFISDLRNCTNPEQEKKRVEKEMAHIRQKFTTEANMNGYNRKKYVWKILYMYMLGYEVDFGHMEAVNLISSPKYSEKSVGYAWCALMLREGDELLRLIINSIRSDLISKQDNAVCLAMASICNVGGKEFAEALTSDVLRQLTANMTKTYVRKKAALTTLRLYRKAPDILPAAEWADKILSLLDEKNIGVLTSVSSLVLGILQIETAGWEAVSAKAARTLTRIVLNKDYSNDYLYYGIPTPWLQIKLLRMLQFFPPPEEHALKMRVSEVLQRIVTGTDVTKNVNKNNVTHAVLFEAINVVIHLGTTSELLPQACSLLGRFISIREANIRYLGLEAMARLAAAQPETMEQLKKHAQTIFFSLKDQDISIRRRALDLVYSMCDSAGVKETVAELLAYLESADQHLKEELVLKIAILAERFRTDNDWYVDVVLSLITTAGDYVSEEIWYRVVQIITNEGDALQAYAAQKVWAALIAERLPHKTLLKVAGYTLGEFGHTIADTEGSRAEDQLRVLHMHYMSSDPDVKALLLNTYAKLSHAYGEIAGGVGDILRTGASAMDQEIQQRSIEYLALGGDGLGEIKNSVLEMMPHFTERESIVQKTLSKTVGEVNSMVAKSQGRAGEDDDEEEKPDGAARGMSLGVMPSAGASAPPAEQPSLLGDDPPPMMGGGAAPSNDLLGDMGGLSMAEAAPPAPPPSNPMDDLLGLGGGMPAAPTPPPSGAMGGADDLLGLMGGAVPAPAPAPAPAPPPAGGAAGSSSAQFTALCVRNDGVLHEDSNIQVGVKMEFQAHQGRLALYVGNKTAQPLTSFSTMFSPQPALALQPAPLASDTIAPRQQAQQMILIECGGPFGDPPQVCVRFVGPAGPTQVVVPMPLPPTKFLVPMVIEGGDFFRRWKGLEGKEKQVIFKLNAVPLDGAVVEEKVGASGLKFALLKGVDPSAANFVASAYLAAKGVAPNADGASVLARLEVNPAAGMCRVSVRSASDALNGVVAKSIGTQLGTLQ